MASGDGFNVDLYDAYTPVRAGDGFNVDAYLTAPAVATGAATISVEAVNTLRSTESANAAISVDVNTVLLPSPARLKRWDGTQWVPGRMYYYDNVSQTWLPSS